MRRRYDTRLKTYSVKVGGRWTTVRLERDLMAAVVEIALSMGLTLNELCTEIAIDRGEGGFTSALRVFVVNHYRRIAAARRAGQLSAAATAAERTDHWMRSRVLGVGAPDVLPEMEQLHRWWRDSCATDSGLVPSHDAIRPDVLRQLGLVGLVHMVDASTSDPRNYRFRVFGKRVVQQGCGDFAGRRVGDAPGREYVAAAAEDYYAVTSSGVARLYEVEAVVAGMRRTYQRFVAPFSGGSGKPDCLLVAVRYRSLGSVEDAPSIGAGR